MKRLIMAVPLLGVLVSAACAGPKTEHTFVLEEHLGHAWQTDLVQRTIEETQPGGLKPDRVGLTIDGHPASVQLDKVETFPDGSVRRADVWFRTDLPAHGKRVVVLRGGDAAKIAADWDITVTRQGNVVELSNGLTAVRLPVGAWNAPDDAMTPALIGAALQQHLGISVATLSGATGQDTVPGPLLGVKLPSGKWTDTSRLTAEEKLVFDPPGLIIDKVAPEGPAGRLLGYDSEVVTQGPMLSRVRIKYRFVGEGSYTIDVSLRRGESMVRIDERYEKAGAIVVPFGSGFKPNKAIYNSFRIEPQGKSIPIAYDKENNFGYLVGWNFYFQKQAPAILLTGDTGGDHIGLVSTAADWLPYPYNQALHLWSMPGGAAGGGQVVAKASLASGHRHWAIVTTKAAQFAEGPNQCKDFYRWWVQRLMLPLSKVSSWQLTWPGMDQIAFPHTFFENKELPAIRKSLQAEPSVQALLKREGAWQLGDKRMTDIAARYLVTGDAALLPKMKAAEEGMEYFDRFVKMYLQEAGPLSDDQVGGMAVSDEMLKRCVGIEFLLGSDQLTPKEKHDLLVKLAFMVYVMHDPYWMPPIHAMMPHLHEPYPAFVQGTPNQKHCYITARGITESALTGHPEMPRWAAHTLEEYQRWMRGSVAQSGVHAESPFYSSRDTMRFGPFLRAYSRAGVKGPILDDCMARVRKTFVYMTDLTTPPEPRMGGVRVYHPLGRSSSGVVDPTFIIAADAWAKDDPAYASRMRWIWEQQGKPSPYILDTTGGRNISLTLLAAVDMFNAKPLEKPPLTSKRWEGFGSIFRSNVGSGYESNVLFRHDLFAWDLYETNNGGVYFYGKGAPLLPRFGAYWTAPNLMSIPFGNRINFASGDTKEEWVNALGNTTDYASLGDVADTASGITEVKDWRRSVIFAKDLDRDDPAYLLVRDQVMRPKSATALHWWVMSKAVQPDGFNKPGVVAYKGSDEGWLANMGKNWKDAPKLKGQLQQFEGQCGVNLDMFIALPTDPTIVTDAVGVGPNLAYNVNREMHEYQQLIRIEQPAQKNYLTLLTPRWPGAAAPQYRTIADGNGVAIKKPDAGGATDFLFLADQPAAYKDDAVISFVGRAGLARTGPSATVRLMITDGHIAFGGITLACKKSAALIARDNLVQVYTDDDPKNVSVTLTGSLKGARVRISSSVKD